MGNFNGDGHVIKGLKISIHNEADADVYAGLFGYVLNGTFCNLGIWLAPEGIEIFSSQSDICAGGLAGYISALYTNNIISVSCIHNCYVEAEGNGTIRGRGTGDNLVNVGGIAGNAYAEITNCYATVNLEVTNIRVARIGGIVGEGGPAISYTYATGKIKCSGSCFIGGITGRYTGSSITNCLALNKEITTDEKGHILFNRIAGFASTSTSNYSTPRMMLNGQLAKNDDRDFDGADTWTDKFKEDLLKEPSDNNEWATAWEWADGKLP